MGDKHSAVCGEEGKKKQQHRSTNPTRRHGHGEVVVCVVVAVVVVMLVKRDDVEPDRAGAVDAEAYDMFEAWRE